MSIIRNILLTLDLQVPAAVNEVNFLMNPTPISTDHGLERISLTQNLITKKQPIFRVILRYRSNLKNLILCLIWMCNYLIWILQASINKTLHKIKASCQIETETWTWWVEYSNHGYEAIESKHEMKKFKTWLINLFNNNTITFNYILKM